MSFYAVARGRGGANIYRSWAECKLAVDGFSGSVFKKFITEADAKEFISLHTQGALAVTPATPSVSATTIDIFIDGACRDNGKPTAKAGYACYFPAYPDYSCKKKLSGTRQTNNRAEYSALILAHKQATKFLSTLDEDIRDDIVLQIYTDSKLLFNAVNFEMPDWKRRGWKKKDNATPKNLDLLQEIDALIIPYQLKWIPAHTGGQDYFSLNNAKVDLMAVEAVDL